MYRKYNDAASAYASAKDYFDSKTPAYSIDDVGSNGGVVGGANRVINNQENDMKQIMRRANDSQSKK